MVPAGGALARIRSKYAEMTSTERRIADKIFSSHKETVVSSIGIMARRCRVSESSIIRFSQTLGYSGFGQLKMALAQDLSHTGTALDTGELETPLDAIDFMAKASSRAIEDTKALLDAESFQRAVDHLADAERIHFYGFGSSGDSAVVAKHLFMRMGMNVDSFTDAHFVTAACNLNKNDAAVGISRTGNAEDTVYALRLAQVNHAFTIGITCALDSGITQFSDCVLLAGTGMPHGNTHLIVGRIAEIMVVNALFLGVAIKKEMWNSQMLPSRWAQTKNLPSR